MLVTLLVSVWLIVTSWTVASQASLSRGILQASIPEWVAILNSGGSSQPADWTPGLLYCRQILYHLNHQGKQELKYFLYYKQFLGSQWLRIGTFTAKPGLDPWSGNWNSTSCAQCRQNNHQKKKKKQKKITSRCSLLYYSRKYPNKTRKNEGEMTWDTRKIKNSENLVEQSKNISDYSYAANLKSN